MRNLAFLNRLSLTRRIFGARWYSEAKFRPITAEPSPTPPEERPFVWKLRGFLTWTVIPGFMAYQVFFADFGDSEHVFSPARRWLFQQKAHFYTLDPAERQLATEELPSTSSDSGEQV